MLEKIKVISKYVKETENMRLRNNILFGEWLSKARTRYKHIKKIYLNNLTNGYIKSAE